MTRRHYQLFALALLIGAPLLVSMLSNMMLGIGHLGPQSAPPPVLAPVEPASSTTPEAEPQFAPPPPAPMLQDAQPGAPFDAAPSLDPSGMSVSGADVMPAAEAGSSAVPMMDLSDGGQGGMSEIELSRANP